MKRNKVKTDAQKRIIRTVDHRSHYVTGVIPQWTDDDLRLHLYNEILEGKDGRYYTSTSQIIMPRSAVPAFLESVKKAVQDQTSSPGPVVDKVPPEVAKLVERSRTEAEQKKKVSKKKVQKIRLK